MSGARRFPPSPRRLAEARRRGEVAVSPALLAAAALLGATAAIVATAPTATRRLLDLSRRAFALDAPPLALLDDGRRALLAVAAPALAAAAVAALAAGIAQTGGLFTLRPLAPTAPRRAPRDGALRSLLLALVAAGATALALRAESDLASRIVDGGAGALAESARALGRVALRVAVAMAAAGVLDLVVRRAALRASLWMTRDEVERERREEEGDPRTAAERRRRARALDGPRLADQVAASTVVVVSEGAAAGLGGDPSQPVVTAAGERLFAARIVDLARRLGTPVRGDDDLAPALAPLRAGDPVPPPLRARARALLEAAHGQPIVAYARGR